MDAYGDRERLLRAIRRVRRRWRLRAVLRGLAVVAGGALAAFLLTGFGLDLLRFSQGAVTAFRVLAYGGVGLLALRFLVPPLVRRVDDARVALYLEEHEPSLDAAVLTAVDAVDPGEASDGLVRRLARDAASRLRRVEHGDRIDRPGLYRWTGVLAGTAVLAVILFLAGPGTLRTGASALLFPNRGAEELTPYSVAVLPGDTTVARGADVLVRARLVGFQSGQARLMTAPAEGDEFEADAMVAVEEGGFEFLLLDVADPIRYFVRSSGVRSPVFGLDVAELPYVDRLDLVYRFPAYTGLEPRTVEDGGNVAALPGTRVEFRAAPTVATPDGRLALDDGSGVALEPTDDGALSGELTVRESGGYRVELRGPDGGLTPASPHYRIDVLRDQPPSVRFEEPGRDSRATPIEEVYLEARADDDYGVGALELVYSINGGAEDTLALYRRDGEPLPSVSAGHTFFLEEWELVPGDVISYYAVARDDDRVSGAKEVVSDIYFLSMRDFRKDLSAAEQRGGGGGGGGASAGSLVQIQRQVVAATFNLVRDREPEADDQWREDLVSVALSQERLRDQVSTLVDQISTRLPSAQAEAFRTVAEELPRAVEAMGEALEELDAERAREALSPEQRALLHLQRADEAYREVQVSLQQQGQGGGGGATPTADDLADLFELELDKLRNQYETVQRSRQRETDQALDETLERLKELARRQQQEAERRERAAGGGGGAASAGERQRALADETEAAARRLERLARERGAPELEETARRLRDAAEAMRRSASERGGGGVADARAARERLEDARRLLDETRAGRFRDQVEDALGQARDLRRQQEEVVEDVRDLEDGDPGGRETRRLMERKEEMAARIEALERQVDGAAARARAEQPGTAEALQDAASGIRDDKLKEKVRFSRGIIRDRNVEQAVPFEEEIARDLEALTERLERARDAAESGAGGEPLEEALEEARSLGRGLETLGRRLRQGGQEPGEAPEGEGVSPPGRAPGGPPSIDPDAARQLRREFRRRAEEAEGLARRLRDAGRPAEGVDRVARRLRALDDPRIYDDPQEVARLQEAAMEGLRRVEFGLRRELRSREGPPIRLPGADDVPPGFREAVEEYFRALSEEEPGPPGGL